MPADCTWRHSFFHPEAFNASWQLPRSWPHPISSPSRRVKKIRVDGTQQHVVEYAHGKNIAGSPLSALSRRVVSKKTAREADSLSTMWKKVVTRQRVWQRKMRARGRCIQCGRPRLEGTRNHCRRHAQMGSARTRARQGTQPKTRARLQRDKTHSRVSRAIKTGALIRPGRCSMCGTADAKINAHHPDYRKPLEVIWLCYRCHQHAHGGVPVSYVNLTPSDHQGYRGRIMNAYPLRRIPDKLWRRTKSIAAKRGLSVRALILEQLKNLTIKTPPNPPAPA